MDLFLENKIIVISGRPSRFRDCIIRTLRSEKAIPVVVETRDREKSISSVIREFGRIDGMINGCEDDFEWGTDEPDNFSERLYKNLLPLFQITQQVLPHLKKSAGAIVNIRSVLKKSGMNTCSVQAASNGAKDALTREWAVELLNHKIRVNEIVITDQDTDAGDSSAKTVVFLLSGRSGHTTGQIIYADPAHHHPDNDLKTV